MAHWFSIRSTFGISTPYESQTCYSCGAHRFAKPNDPGTKPYLSTPPRNWVDKDARDFWVEHNLELAIEGAKRWNARVETDNYKANVQFIQTALNTEGARARIPIPKAVPK